MEPFFHRLSEYAWDHYYGISTRGWLKPEELGLPAGCLSYTPTPYRGFRDVMKHVPSHLVAGGTFLDFGSGLGRVVMLASLRFPFRDVIGVEYSDSLCRRARANMESAQVRNVSIVCADARQFDIPPHVTVFFLANPFLGDVLRVVVEKIRIHQRPFAVVVCNYSSFEGAIDGATWL